LESRRQRYLHPTPLGTYKRNAALCEGSGRKHLGKLTQCLCIGAILVIIAALQRGPALTCHGSGGTGKGGRR
jgi:hypothetical protein